jgi:hypothetical protein
VWLSLYNSATSLAPRMAYCSSRRTHRYNSAADRSRPESTPGLSATNLGSGRHARLPGALAGGPGRALADRLGVAGRHAQPVATEGLAQRWPGGPQLLRSGVDAVQLLGQRVGPARLWPGRWGARWAASPAGGDRGPRSTPIHMQL